MKVQVLQEGLSRAVGELARVIPSKSPLPITANVLLKTAGGRLLLTADNLDQRATVEVGAMVVEEGAITVDGRRFAASLANLPAVSLSLDVVGTELAVDGGNAKLRFPTIAADDFPQPGGLGEFEAAVEVPPDELRVVARSVAAAAALDDSRPVLTGVVLSVAPDGQRTWAAADGFRLHVHGSPTGEPGIIIPAKAVRLLAGMMAGSEPVRLEMDAGRSRLRATWDAHEFTTLAVQGTFPNYRQLIPDEFSATWDADGPALLHAVRIAAGFAETGMVRFYGREGRIRVRGLGQGEGEATVDAEMTGDPDEHRFALNTRYATEALAAFDGTVTIGTNGPSAPAVFRAGPLTHVVMPMFTEWGS